MDCPADTTTVIVDWSYKDRPQIEAKAGAEGYIAQFCRNPSTCDVYIHHNENSKSYIVRIKCARR
jgi:hypothetical protein